MGLRLGRTGLTWARYRYRVRLAVAGLVLAQGAPAGLWFLEKSGAVLLQPDQLPWLRLAYAAVSTSVVFALFGLMMGALLDELHAAREALALEAREDALTGLANRRELDRRLQLELARAQRTGEPVALIILDIDHFKVVNDRYGHPAGDAVLRAIAAQIRHGCRAADLAARYGGEEFALLAPGLGAAAAANVAERIRVEVASVVTEFCRAPIQVTVSAGVASTTGMADVTPHGLIAAADAQLLLAKQAGRNRVFLGGMGHGEGRDPPR